MPCDLHKSSWEKHWLPSLEGTLRPHPACKNCGTVKNISWDRAKGMGYYVNALTDMKKHFERNGGKLADVQLRLISRELEGTDAFNDAYWILGSTQKNIFIQTVRKYIKLSPRFIESFL